MGMGSYDEDEQARQNAGDMELSDETNRADYDGEVDFELGSAEEMVSNWQDLQDDLEA
jgi:hypothetical protein